MAWTEVECYQEITKVFYLHASHDGLSSITKSELDFKEQVETFLDQFIKGYQGAADVLSVLHSLILHSKPYSCLRDVHLKLKWLKCKNKLQRNMYDLCKEEDMSDFPTDADEKIPVPLKHYPDNFSKLMPLMDYVLQNPMYYPVFQKYCEQKPALRKYITQDMTLTNEIIGYVGFMHLSSSSSVMLFVRCQFICL